MMWGSSPPAAQVATQSSADPSMYRAEGWAAQQAASSPPCSTLDCVTVKPHLLADGVELLLTLLANALR